MTPTKRRGREVGDGDVVLEFLDLMERYRSARTYFFSVAGGDAFDRWCALEREVDRAWKALNSEDQGRARATLRFLGFQGGGGAEQTLKGLFDILEIGWTDGGRQ